MLLGKFKFLIAYLIISFMLVSCLSGGSTSSSNYSPYNMRGIWTGTFTGNDGTTLNVSINILSQANSNNNETVSGTANISSSSATVTGNSSYSYLYNHYLDYHTDLEIHSINKTCCNIFTGCSQPDETVGVIRLSITNADIINNRIMNGAVRYKSGCVYVEDGSVVLVKQ